MEFFDVVKQRRSVRKFTDQKVEPEKILRALEAATLAPNSSNLQPWEFYWVKSEEKKKQLVTACMSQNAAATAQELIVAVARKDTWRRNRKLLLEWAYQSMKTPPKMLLDYYNKLIPMAYISDPFGVLNLFRYLSTSIIGLFRPIPRSSCFEGRHWENLSKTVALGCENLMLALTAQDLASCPMEGFDEARVKKILNLNSKSHVVMVIGTGYSASDGLYSEQFRVPKNLVVHEI